MDENPIARAYAVVDRLNSVGEEALAAWLQDGVDRFVYFGERLDEALSLVGGGSNGRSIRYRYIEVRLQSLIREAHSYCGTWAELSRQVEHYRLRLWSQYQNRPPRDDWTPLVKAIDAAFRLRRMVPDTPQGLAKLAKRNGVPPTAFREGQQECQCVEQPQEATS